MEQSGHKQPQMTAIAAAAELAPPATVPAGSTWRPFNAGLHVLGITSLAIDKTGQTLYAATAARVAAVHLQTK
jgi:hypothetical protein